MKINIQFQNINFKKEIIPTRIEHVLDAGPDEVRVFRRDVPNCLVALECPKRAARRATATWA